MPQSNPETTRPLPPGSTIGVFGGGQLGRMLAQAARGMGYRTHVFAPEPNCPAAQVADEHTSSEYTDREAVERFARAVDVVTIEFENVPTDAVELAAQFVPTRPSAHVLRITQDRLREKRFLVDAGIPCAPFAEVATDDQLQQALREVGTPAVLKTTGQGYDGKGQVKIAVADEADEAWNSLGRRPAVWEAFVDYRCELSVIVARSPRGEVATFGPILNHHAQHILDVSILPAEELTPVADKARRIAVHAGERLAATGMLCVEFFLTRDSHLLVNEIAPRTHNSGHLTIEACRTSQFHQQVLAICGQPLGPTHLVAPAAAMANLLGDMWTNGEPLWKNVRDNLDLQLHLYGKAEPKPGRKMGHLTALAGSVADAERAVREARSALLPPAGA